MQLESIDKPLYRRRFKVVAVGLALGLAFLSLSFSTILIALFGVEAGEGSNTLLNGLGVALAGLVLLLVLQRLRIRPYFYEVEYVWRLKQELNQITRRLRKLKLAVEAGDRTAMVILNFSYQASCQLWTLDDNTLVLEDLQQWQTELQAQIDRHGVSVELAEYHRGLLKAY